MHGHRQVLLRCVGSDAHPTNEVSTKEEIHRLRSLEAPRLPLGLDYVQLRSHNAHAGQVHGIRKTIDMINW